MMQLTCFPLSIVVLLGAWLPLQAAEFAASPLPQLIQAAPQTVKDCTPSQADQLDMVAERLDEWAAGRAQQAVGQPPQQVLAAVKDLVRTKQQVDSALERALGLRDQLGALPAGAAQKAALRNYLRSTSRLIDMSGRLRYLLRDAIDNATLDLGDGPAALDPLLDLLTEAKLSIGASVLAFVLFDPAPDSGLQPYPLAARRKVLQLMEACRSSDSVEDLAEFVRESKTPELTVQAARILWQLGLPQDPRPGQDSSLPPPPITAKQLDAILRDERRIPAKSLSGAVAQQRQLLLQRLAQRIRVGVTGDYFTCGGFQVRAGDWLLMRNPSPYNLFTDLSPGLFTHVGVVAVEEGTDGIRRFVIVDMPERGSRIPATNVDLYLRRTLHYFFMRHRDPAVGRVMGQVAADVIGNETQFDLLFRTERVEALRGKPLKGQRIHTYCAGFLLMCAQETAAPRADFFPIAEKPAGGHCLANLKKLGLSISDNFVSPSGALFSAKMQLVGRRAPMYDPGREIQEFVYDCFAQGMIQRELTPSPDTYQALRQKLAQLSKFNPWLARALASANNVSEHIDLEAAAKAAAVIETLDEIALENSRAFFAARRAVMAGTVAQLKADGLASPQLQEIQEHRRRHADLYALWLKEELTPRQLRVKLVQHYSQQGKRRLDERFFRQPTSP